MCLKNISLEFLGKFAFHLVGKRFVFMELTQNILKVLCMLFYCFGVHQDIINVNDHKLVQLFMENKVHEGCEHQRSVAQPQWHH
jgi:hypothetical protein